MIHNPKVTYLFAVFMLALFPAPSSQPQSLDDWKAALSAAQSGRGCESIPYSNYRDQCMRKSEKVEELCKTDSWTCEGLKTKAVRENIKGLSEYIAKLKEEKERLNSQKSNAGSDDEKNEIQKKIDEVETKTYEKTKELDFQKKGLETDLSDIELRLYKGRQCLEARTDVQEVFKSSTGDAGRESDSEIKAIANQLIEYWAKKRDEHQTAFDNVRLGIEKCNKCKDGEL